MNFTPINFPNYLEVKCLRVQKPLPNLQSLPLSGNYNDILNEEDLNTFPFVNKFKHFETANNNSIGISNLFMLNNKFGKVLLMEDIELILSFVNSSDRELQLHNLKITLQGTPKDQNGKAFDKNILTSQNPIKIQPKTSFTTKIKVLINTNSKYAILITSHCLSTAFDEHYRRENQRTTVRTKTDKYTIENGKVFQNYSKRLTFDAVIPFVINDPSSPNLSTNNPSYHDNQMESSDINVSFTNVTPNDLLIQNIMLYPDKKRDEIIHCENNKNKRDTSFYLRNGEEYNALFKIKKLDIVSTYDNYIVGIQWVNNFDCVPKLYQILIQNKSKLKNDTFELMILEKPQSDIVQGKNFKIVFNIKNKTKSALKLKIHSQRYTTSEQEHIKEFEVIDIVDSTFELKECMSFSMICKSDVIGIVYLPLLHISYGDKKTISFDKLLYFNCVENEHNINQ